MKITAAVVREKAQPFTIEELELDTPRADKVLVPIVATGLCHTDLLVRDNYPHFSGTRIDGSTTLHKDDSEAK